MTPAHHPPVPFIVGFPRSGTTLLRLMLDAHPELAIPPETGFTGDLAARPPCDAEDAWRRITRFPPDAPGWPDFHLNAGTLLDDLGRVRPFSAAEAVRRFYQLYAARFGKTRWGDKTPSHLPRMREIAALLPEVRFIHIIRDGRDAVVSLRRQWFAPSQDIRRLAAIWRDEVRLARANARQGLSCVELRYEDLVQNPSQELQRICDFIELPFHPAILHHHESAAERLDEHGERIRVDGTMIVTRERRRLQQINTRRAPDASLIGTWKSEFSADERTAFLDEAGELLAELGYALD